MSENETQRTSELISQLKEVIKDYENEPQRDELIELKELKSGKAIKVSQITHRKLSTLKLLYKCATFDELIERIIETPVSLLDDNKRLVYDGLLQGFIEKINNKNAVRS